MLIEKLNFNKKIDPISDILQWKERNEGAPIIIWGAGSVAYGVLSKLLRSNICIDEVVIDSLSCRVDERIEKSNFTICTWNEIRKKYNKVAVLIGHSHFEKKYEIEKEPFVDAVFVLVDCVRSDTEINSSDIFKNEEKFERVYNLLEDNVSKNNMVAYLNTKLTNDIGYVLEAYLKNHQLNYFDTDVLNLGDGSVYVDCGAYEGENIDDFIFSCPNYDKIVAIEVIKEQADFLIEKYNTERDVTVYNIGVSDHSGKDLFMINGQSTCLCDALDDGGVVIPVDTLDNVLTDMERIDIIKLCIGNTILPILCGAKNVIQKYHPQFVVSAGIGAQILTDTIDWLSNNSKYRFYLRFVNPIPESIILYAIPQK